MRRPGRPDLTRSLARVRGAEPLKRLPVVGKRGEEAEAALEQARTEDAHVLTLRLAPGEVGYVRRSSLIFADGDFGMTTKRIASRRVPFLGLFSGQNLWANQFEAGESPVTVIAGRDYHGLVLGLEVSEGEPIFIQPGLYLGHVGALSFTVRRVAKREFWTLTEVTGEGIVYVKAPGRTLSRPLSQERAVIVDTNYVAAVRGAFRAHGKVFTGGQYLRSGEAENVRLTGDGDVLIQSELPPENRGGGGFLGGLLDLFV